MSESTPSLLPFAEIESASEILAPHILRTPLLPLPELAERAGIPDFRVKCENVQRTGSFKFRGALHFLSRLSREEGARGVITYSSGNHGQGMALAARILGFRAVVVMPETVPPIKRARAEAFGAEVHLAGTTSLHRYARAVELAEAEGLSMVPPFDHPRIIAGQGTVGLEIATEFPEVEAVFVPVGGGGLLAGTAVALRALLPSVRIIGVEPVGAAAMGRAWQAGEPITLERIDTLADGLAPVRVGEWTFAHVRELVDEMVTVTDEEIRSATRLLHLQGKVLAEYSGAASTAAALRRTGGAQGEKVVAVLSGGNMDPAILSELHRPGGASEREGGGR